ncbi:NAD(P)/FAD-dependent oxidoreductase [Nocardioides sp.]|uniref:phytoene desaturase family protein n=1 Tax=Nocardioides sp. TaxID=35761 RepID=UPI002ED5A43C
MTVHDAVVVGAGPNGLVAANLLADAGWSVLVLEEQPTPGGAVRSDRDVHEGFVHDTFSAFYPLGAASPILAGLELEAHGLRWTHAPAVLGHATEGRWTMLYRDRTRTAAALDEAAPGDGESWLALCETWDRIEKPLLAGLFTPFPPLRPTPRLLAAVARTGGLDLVRTLLLPAVDLARPFRGPGPGLLLAGNAGHADLPLASPGSGFFGLLLCMLGQRVGFPVPVGGAGMLTGALVSRLTGSGGQVECGRAVTRVLVKDGRAAGVATSDGEEHLAGRAVLADTSLPALAGSLLAAEELPPRLARQISGFRLDPGTVKVDWALSGAVPWATPPPAAPGTVHVSASVTEMTTALTQVAAGAVPSAPFLLVGQMTTADPTRSPPGTESMWAYAHVPQPDETVTDAGNGGIRGAWDHDECQRFADRMQAQIEALAPGFSERILARRVLGPRELESRNRNLVGGALNGGTAQLHQQLVFRPVPAMRGRTETGVPGLYLASAAAHPGGAVHGAPGHAAARAALAHDRLARWRPGRNPR